MKQAQTMILIPHFLAEALKRHDLLTKDCLDIGKMRNCVSALDIAQFLVLQRHLALTIGEDVNSQVSDVPNGEWTLTNIWERNAGNQTPLHDFIRNTISPLALDPNTEAEMLLRVFSPDALDSSSQLFKDADKYFYTYDLTPDTFGVVVAPGVFGGQNAVKAQRSLVEAYLKQQQAYLTPAELSRSFVFGRYMVLLEAEVASG